MAGGDNFRRCEQTPPALIELGAAPVPAELYCIGVDHAAEVRQFAPDGIPSRRAKRPLAHGARFDYSSECPKRPVGSRRHRSNEHHHDQHIARLVELSSRLV